MSSVHFRSIHPKRRKVDNNWWSLRSFVLHFTSNMVYPRVHDPVLYEWEIDETHDRYDYPRAWPSSTRLHVEFSILATINALTSSVVFLLIVAILRSNRVRSNVFNMYLLAIAFPDFLVSFLCCITCAMSAPGSQFYSEWMCGFQSFYLNWAFISNAWLNGVVVFQIHRMLRHSQNRRRYIPPKHKHVFGHTMLVYAYASFWGFLCGFNIDFLPHSSHLYYGFACMPMEYDRASTLFFWLVYLPLSLGVPLVFAIYVTADILIYRLLPPTGKRRALSMFLLRLCFLYFAIWLPFLILFLVGNFVVINPLVHWIGAAISHLQGLFSALFCLTNPEIFRSFVILLTCQDASSEEMTDGSDLRDSPGRDLATQSNTSSFFFRRHSSNGRYSQNQGSRGPSVISSSSRKSEEDENMVEQFISKRVRWNIWHNRRSSEGGSAETLVNDSRKTREKDSQEKVCDEYEKENMGNAVSEQCPDGGDEIPSNFKPEKTEIRGQILEDNDFPSSSESVETIDDSRDIEIAVKNKSDEDRDGDSDDTR